MAFAGQSEDAIALYYGLHKNNLRARFADALDRGRDRARDAAAEAETPTKTDQILLDAIKASFDSDWNDPQFGNLLFDGATSIEQAIEECKQYGHFRDSEGKP